MKKILISWMAFNHDFLQGNAIGVNPDGTTASFHEYFYKENYEKHLILSSAIDDDTRMDYLLNHLRRNFPDHTVEPRYMSLSDVIDLEQILSKIGPLLFEFRNREIDLFISPGTPAMQTAWVLVHMTLGLKTKLLQVRPKQYTESRQKPELVFVNITRDATTSSAIIRQAKTEDPDIFQATSEFLETDSIKPVYQKALHVAQASNTTVLIYGETGTGKEHLTRYIHDQSPRREAPFLAVNCSALGDQLLESRLFGYKKGAFTDAIEDTPGIIELAQGGTIFLDEIGDISPYMQQALLRVLQEKEITPIGGQPKKMDVRFVCATNKDLLKLCKQGKFRWDLYYRLSVIDLELPSLQERGIKEIKELIRHFVHRKKKLFNRDKPLQIPKSIMEHLLSYPFPGNIRELENLIERLYVLSIGQTLTPKDLPQRIREPQPAHSLRLKDLEKVHIERVLRLNKGKKTKTARDLDIAFNTLESKLEKYEIKVRDLLD